MHRNTKVTQNPHKNHEKKPAFPFLSLFHLTKCNLIVADFLIYWCSLRRNFRSLIIFCQSQRTSISVLGTKYFPRKSCFSQREYGTSWVVRICRGDGGNRVMGWLEAWWWWCLGVVQESRYIHWRHLVSPRNI